MKVAVVTGAARGIGGHFAKALFQKGYSLAVADVDMDVLMEAFPEESDRLFRQRLDVCRPQDWRLLLQEVMSRYGRLDYLFNIAGVVVPGRIVETPLEEIDRHLDVNTKGVMYGSKLAAGIMVRQGSGHIINVASLAGMAPVSGISLYSASKFAVRGFSLALAYELRPQGVAVSVVCPDLVDTRMLDQQLDYEEAALSFSGSRKPLTVFEVEKALWKVMRSKRIEVAIPASRGWLSKLGSFFPSSGFWLTERLRKKGLQQLKKARALRKQNGA